MRFKKFETYTLRQSIVWKDNLRSNKNLFSTPDVLRICICIYIPLIKVKFQLDLISSLSYHVTPWSTCGISYTLFSYFIN